ncbi:MAG: DMT family transporter [bacterium]
MNAKSLTFHYLILAAAVFYGLITVGGKYFADLGFSLYEIALLISFSALTLIPVLLFNKKFRIRKAHLAFFIVFGLIGALLQLSQFAGIVLGVPVAVVALLLYTQPVWTTLLGRWLLEERITLKKLFVVPLAVVGILILVSPFQGPLRPDGLGLLAALCAGIFLALWVIWGRSSGLRDQHFVTTTFGYSFFSALWLLVFYPVVHTVIAEVQISRLSFENYLEHWPGVAGYTLLAGLTPACLAFAGMKRVETSTAGILLLFEPVSAAALAYWLFGQPLTANVWFGGGVILLANYLLLKGASA